MSFVRFGEASGKFFTCSTVVDKLEVGGTRDEDSRYDAKKLEYEKFSLGEFSYLELPFLGETEDIRTTEYLGVVIESLEEEIKKIDRDDNWNSSVEKKIQKTVIISPQTRFFEDFNRIFHDIRCIYRDLEDCEFEISSKTGVILQKLEDKRIIAAMCKYSTVYIVVYGGIRNFEDYIGLNCLPIRQFPTQMTSLSFIKKKTTMMSFVNEETTIMEKIVSSFPIISHCLASFWGKYTNPISDSGFEDQIHEYQQKEWEALLELPNKNV